MIYLLDDFTNENSHGFQMTKVIKHYTNVELKQVNVPNIIDNDDLYDVFENLLKEVKTTDIVAIPWAKDIDLLLDDYCNRLCDICHVLVSAGNFGVDIKDYSPTRAKKVTVVGAYNKKLQVASHSNYSQTKELVYVIGTNIYIDGVKYHGTSTSCVTYASFLANSLVYQQNLNDQIDSYHQENKLD